MTQAPLIVGISGSLRGQSYSRAAVAASLAMAQARGARTALLDPRELNLPLYLPDTPIDGYPVHHQPGIRTLVETCAQADAMVWASPTYHGTITGAFKNAIDFLDFLGNDPRPYLKGRAVALIAVSDPVTLAAMQNCVQELRAWLAPTQLAISSSAFDAAMVLQDERIQRRLARQMDELMEFVS